MPRILCSLILLLIAGAARAQEADDGAIAAARRWNDALATHQLVTLETFYGERVRFYGRDFSRAQVMRQKRAALAQAPDFRQWLADLQAEPLADGRVRVHFLKFWSMGGRTRSVGASLLLSRGSGAWQVVGESDVMADKLSGARRAATGGVHNENEALERLWGQLATARPGGLSPRCIMVFEPDPEQDAWEFVLRERHEGRCPGDPASAPLLGVARVTSAGQVLFQPLGDGPFRPLR